VLLAKKAKAVIVSMYLEPKSILVKKSAFKVPSGHSFKKHPYTNHWLYFR